MWAKKIGTCSRALVLEPFDIRVVTVNPLMPTVVMGTAI